MFRVIGAFLVFLGGLGIAERLTDRERQKLRVGEAYLDFLRYIRGELHAFCRPREEVFRRYDNKVLWNCGFLPALRRTGEIREALASVSPPVDQPLAALLTSFGGTLGRGYLTEELAACDVYIERLESYVAGVRAGYPSRVRVRRACALTGTLLLILLLL